jgi:F0F1-type ATP synthase assembly protein I
MAARGSKKQNPLVAFLVAGLLIGALAGYLTRPETAEIRVGPISVEVRGNNVARGGEMTRSQFEHIAVVALIGGIIGLGIGFMIKSGKLKV